MHNNPINFIINAMKEGAYGYLAKPSRMDDIQLRVERALQGRKTQLSLKSSGA